MRGKDHSQCLTEETLTDYLEGALDPAIKAASEVHLIVCDDCRNRLGLFMRLLDQEIQAEETHTLQLITAEWEKKKQQNQPRTGTVPSWVFGVVGVAAALLIGVLSARTLIHRQAEPTSASQIIQLLLAQQRPFESRLANEPHLPIVRTRGVDDSHVAYGLVAGEMTRLSANAHEMGRFYLLQKDFGRAIPYLEIAAREVGAGPSVHNDLGVAYLESADTGQADKAGVEFRQALMLDPVFVPAEFNLSLFYEKANDTARAAVHWKHYLELDSKSDWAKEARGRLQGLSR